MKRENERDRQIDNERDEWEKKLVAKQTFDKLKLKIQWDEKKHNKRKTTQTQ